MSNQAVMDKILTREETAKLLRISIQMLDTMRALKKIAFIRVGRRILFKESEVLKFLEDNTISSK